MKKEAQRLIIEIIVLIITIISSTTFFLIYSHTYNEQVAKLTALSSDLVLTKVKKSSTTLHYYTDEEALESTDYQTLEISSLHNTPTTYDLTLCLKKIPNTSSLKIKVNDTIDYLDNFYLKEDEHYLYYQIYRSDLNNNLVDFNIWISQDQPNFPKTLTYHLEVNNA